MKINGPFDKFGKKLPPVTPSELKKSDKYDKLSPADRVKLLQQNYRELKMEEARQNYPLKFLPPVNRNYVQPPSSDGLEDRKRPHVRVSIPVHTNKSVLVSNIIPSWGGSHHSKLNIRLPINVSLATVLKNIYEHMYQYYFHRHPLKEKKQGAVDAREVIQGLVNKDMKNVSNLVRSRDDTRGSESVDKDKLHHSRRDNHNEQAYKIENEQLMSTDIQPDTISSLRPKSSMPIESYSDEDRSTGIMSEYAKPLEDGDGHAKEEYYNKLKAERIFSTLPELSEPIYPNNKNSPLRLTLEPYLKTLTYLKQLDPRVLQTRFAKKILNIPLIAIQKEEKRKREKEKAAQFEKFYRQNKLRGPSLFNIPRNAQAIQKARYVDAVNKKQAKGALSKELEKHPKPTPASPPSNYFLIDTTGVASNKPMVIETVEEYFKKKKASQHAHSKENTRKPRGGVVGEKRMLGVARIPNANNFVVNVVPYGNPQSFYANSLRNVDPRMQMYKSVDTPWDKRYNIVNSRYYHPPVTRNFIPRIDGKYFNNEEILLQRHHHLHKQLKLMKRFADESEMDGKKQHIRKLNLYLQRNRIILGNTSADNGYIGYANFTHSNLQGEHFLTMKQKKYAESRSPILDVGDADTRRNGKLLINRGKTDLSVINSKKRKPRKHIISSSKIDFNSNLLSPKDTKASFRSHFNQSETLTSIKPNRQYSINSQMNFENFHTNTEKRVLNENMFNDVDMGKREDKNMEAVELLTKSLEGDSRLNKKVGIPFPS